MASRQDTYQAMMSEGHSLAWSLKWEAASQKYRQVLTEFGDDATARLSLAVALSKLGRLAEALAEYQAVSRLLPNDSLVLMRIAELHLRLGERQSAIKSYVDLAELHHRHGEPVKATGVWRKAIELAEDSPMIRFIHEALIRIGEQEIADELGLHQIAALDTLPPTEVVGSIPDVEIPDHEERQPDEDYPAATDSTQTTKAQTEVWKTPEQMLAEADRLADQGRMGPAVQFYLRSAEMLRQTDRSDEADQTVKLAMRNAAEWLYGGVGEALALSHDERLRVVAAMADGFHYLQGDLIKASLDASMEAIGNAPRFLPAQLLMAQVFQRQGRSTEARETRVATAELYELRGEKHRAADVWSIIAETDPKDVASRRTLARLLAEIGLDRQAAEQYLAAARICISEGDAEQALSDQRNALRLHEDAMILLEHGWLLEELGRIDEALETYRRSRELDPENPQILAALCSCLAVAGEIGEVEALLDSILAAAALDPSIADPIVERWKKSLERELGNHLLTYCLGRLLLTIGASEAGSQHLEGAIQAATGRVRILSCYYLAAHELDGGDTQRARYYLTMAMEASEAELSTAMRIEACKMLARAHAAAEDWDGVAYALERHRSLGPPEEWALSQLAEAHFRSGHFEDALAALRELAEFHESHGEDERALAVFQGIAQLAPDDPAASERLAQAYLKRGLVREALIELHALVEMELRQSSKEDAIKHLQVMLELCKPTDAQRALRIREQLASLCPDDATVRQDLITAYLQAGRSSRALAEARDLAEILLAQHRLVDAVEALQLLLRLDPWNQSASRRLKEIRARIQEITEACHQRDATSPRSSDDTDVSPEH